MNLAVVDEPGLAVHAVRATFPGPLEQVVTAPWLAAMLQPAALADRASDEGLRAAVRDVLRRHGYRPTGRGKPSSEYLAAAVAEGRLGAINAAVDAGNAVSLHSGLPISVVDLARCRAPLSIAVPPAGASYVFNRSGQTIDVAGLVSLCDAEGPCANAVKDAQRTKTSPQTTDVLAIVWGTTGPDPGHAAATAARLGDVFQRLGALVERVR